MAEIVSKNFQKDANFPNFLSGDFAIVIWDESEQSLTLIKDHMGTRPLYYVRNDAGVTFASDIESLLPSCRDPGRLYEDKIADYLDGCLDGGNDRTLLEEIYRVPPATRVQFTHIKVIKSEYWRPEDAPDVRYQVRQDYFDHGAELLRQSVIERTPHEGPFGTHLSGGLDSSAIAAFASSHRHELGQSMPVGFGWQPAAAPGEEQTKDQALLDFCAATFGIEGNSVGLSQDVFMNYLLRDPAKMPMTGELSLELGVMKLANAKVLGLMMSGWGGDQTFSFSGRSRWRSILPLWLLQMLDRRGIKRSAVPRTYTNVGWRKPSGKQHILDMFQRQGARASQIAMIRYGYISERMDCWSVAGAGFDLQYVFPLVDRRLVEFALGVPREIYQGDTLRRNLMREAMKGAVPDRLRLNPDKIEAARFADTFDAHHEIAPQLLKKLLEKNYHAERLKYVNLAAITRDIEKMAASKKVPYGKLDRALSFLLLPHRDHR